MQRLLVTNGYYILRALVPKDKCQEMLATASTPTYNPLFKSIKEMDDHRLQGKVPKKLVDELRAFLTPFARMHFDQATLNDWFFLKSIPGGKKQAPHKDYVLPVKGKKIMFDIV